MPTSLTPYQRRTMYRRRRDGRTAPQQASADGDTDLITLYLAQSYPVQPLVDASHHAPGTSVWRLLQSQGGDLSRCGHKGYTPLMSAVRSNDFEKVQFLLDAGVDVNEVTFDGGTALSEASGQSLALVRLLLQHGALPNAKTDQPVWSALHWAMERAFPQGVGSEALKRSVGRTQEGLAMAQLLLERGADPNVVRPDGDTPFVMALKHAETEMLDRFLAAGARINGKIDDDDDYHDVIAPLGAVIGIFFNAARFDWVLTQRPNLDAPVLYGRSALQEALLDATTWSVEDRAYCVQRLLDEGADPHRSPSGQTASPFVLFWAQLTELDPKTSDEQPFGASGMWQRWMEHPRFNPNAVEINGQPLLSACLSSKTTGWVGSPEKVAELLQRGAQPNSLNAQGQTPLHVLLSGTIPPLEGAKERLEILVEQLMAFGADVNLGTPLSNGQPTGNSLLHLAANHALSKPFLERLVQSGLDVNGANAALNTPLHRAAQAGDETFILVLLEHGANSSLLNAQGQRPDEVILWNMPNAERLRTMLFADHERRALRAMDVQPTAALRSRQRL